MQSDIDTNESDADAAIAALQSDIDTNESDADTAIALVQTNLDAHTTADLDLSATNELSDLNLDAGTNILTLTNPATGTNEIDLSSYVSTDDQNLETPTFSSASILGINIEGGNDAVSYTHLTLPTIYSV